MLELDGLSKRFGDVVALDRASLQVAPGRLLGFLGPNGAGKTTAMRAIFGLVALDAGEVRWRGAAVDGSARRRFGYLPEQRGLYPKMPVLDQVVWFGRLKGLGRADARRAALALLQRFGLADRAHDPLEKLSHGNQQRAQLAAAMVHEPDVLVLDEPFSGLDPVAVDELGAVLRQYAERGAAVLFSSHQLDLVEDLCQDVAIVAAGRVRATGPLDELRAATGRRSATIGLESPPGTALPATDWAAAFPGGEVEATGPGWARLRFGTDVDPAEVLARARALGPVRQFTWEPPSLTEVFREVVTT